MTGSLSAEQLAAYRRDGFVFPVRVASAERARGWRDEMEALERAHGPLHYLPKAHLVVPLADRLARDPAVLDAVESLLGPDLLLWDCAFIVKEAGDGKRVTWHQDLTYWGLQPADVASIWLALSPATPQSGCMRMMPGSQSGPQLRHRDNKAPDNILSRGQEIDTTVDESLAIDTALAPGEMSIHHGRTWHASHPNRSGDRRIGFNAQYLAPWVRQAVGDWDSALLVRGEDRYGHFAAEWSATTDFVPDQLARMREISARRDAYLSAQ
jgi:ectoine hydroxylase-related dioxygenase (phytanoyl-CoA dioxygenase family)